MRDSNSPTISRGKRPSEASRSTPRSTDAADAEFQEDLDRLKELWQSDADFRRLAECWEDPRLNVVIQGILALHADVEAPSLDQLF